ncbi:hypothetical protein MTQ93_09705 [Staphylococcus agnetis]|uniref:hypothetical protein n=1 Tax=Staphylococcus agnetis TaxID=985762 RepID=UPI00208E35E5|nr:hypothetical protein [Staphylococcus agnetis]MCO4346319.1 hypothetical protein [Staphylococcus agnetis]MCO4360605.1 hypothetical protein [Staphylococcus agnetis]
MNGNTYLEKLEKILLSHLEDAHKEQIDKIDAMKTNSSPKNEEKKKKLIPFAKESQSAGERAPKDNDFEDEDEDEDVIYVF